MTLVEEMLGSIDAKPSQVVAMQRLANANAIKQIQSQLAQDKEHCKILELCEQPIAYSEILTQVTASTGAAETTVKRRLAELRELGVVATSRKGRGVYYINSGLFHW